MTDPKTILFNWALDRSASEPNSVRVPVLRALAEYAGDNEQAKELTTIADALECADQRAREFAFNFASLGRTPANQPRRTTR